MGMTGRGPVEIRTAPHLKRSQDVATIMRHVVYALLPVVAYSFWQFGISVVALVTSEGFATMVLPEAST